MKLLKLLSDELVTSIIEREVGEGGEFAKTEYWLEEYISEEDISVVKLKLYTGRTHQIRVHMKYKGYPLLGDELYGGDVSNISRQALHCMNLKFYSSYYRRSSECKSRFTRRYD